MNGVTESTKSPQRAVPLLGSVGILMGGTLLAQLVPLIAAPFYTRLYAPAQIGEWVVFTGIVGVFCVLLTGRFDLAVLLPEQESEAATLLISVMCIGAALGVLLCAVSFILNEAFFTTPRGGYFRLSPLILAAAIPFAWMNLLQGWANRRAQYWRISGTSFALQAVVAVAGISLSALFDIGEGLIFATVAGYWTAAAALAAVSWRELRDAAPRAWARQARSTLMRYRNFPKFNLPFSLLTTVGVRLPVYLLVIARYPAEAGFVGLSRAVVFVPITFLSTSLGRVFFRSAANSLGTKHFESVVLAVYHSLSTLGPALFATVFVWAPDLFSLVFGHDWTEAGAFASALVPASFAYLFTSWASRVFEVVGRQKHMLTVQVVADTGIILVVSALLLGGVSPLVAIYVYSLMTIGYSAVYLHGIVRYGGFDRRAMTSIVVRACLSFVTWAAVLSAIRYAVPSIPLAIGLSVLCVTSYLSLQVRRYVHRWSVLLAPV